MSVASWMHFCSVADGNRSIPCPRCALGTVPFIFLVSALSPTFGSFLTPMCWSYPAKNSSRGSLQIQGVLSLCSFLLFGSCPVLYILMALISLNFHIISSTQEACWALLRMAWKLSQGTNLGQLVGSPSLFLISQGSPSWMACCQYFLFCTFCFFLVVSGRKLYPVPIIPSWLKVEWASLHFFSLFLQICVGSFFRNYP